MKTRCRWMADSKWPMKNENKNKKLKYNAKFLWIKMAVYGYSYATRMATYNILPFVRESENFIEFLYYTRNTEMPTFKKRVSSSLQVIHWKTLFIREAVFGAIRIALAWYEIREFTVMLKLLPASCLKYSVKYVFRKKIWLIPFSSPNWMDAYLKRFSLHNYGTVL